MNSKLHESTPEFVIRMYEQQGLYLRDLSPLLLLEISILKELSKREKNSDERIMEGLHSLSNFANYISLELASVSRSNFRAALPAEQRYNLKYINCIILEAYKYLYGYKKSQNKSLWVKKLKPLLELIDDQDFNDDYNSLELKIKQFGESNITDLVGRNLSFHYDLDPMEVYKHLIVLSEEDEYQRLLAFSGLINELSIFSFKYIQKIDVTNALFSEIVPDFNMSLVELGIFSDGYDDLCNTLLGTIDKHSKRLDDIARKQDIPQKLHEIFKKDISTSILSLVELSKVAMQLSYIYIDLASAIRAFFNAEYIIEKLINLKQINVIVYEGFNKLFSLNDNSNDSFWQSRIVPFILEVKDDRFHMEVEILNQQLEDFKSTIKISGVQRQLSVHYEKGIPKIYDMLQGLNPIKEISKSIQLLGLMQEIYNILNNCMRIIEDRQEIENNKIIENRNTLINKIIALTSNLPDDSFKTKLLDDLQKMKTGEFFDNLLKNRPKD